jgi:D-lactate dehydrogenase
VSNNSLPSTVISELDTLFGSENVLTDSAQCWAYGYDNSRRHAPPQAVVFATQHEQVVALVALCNTHRIPLLARGRGTSTTGASVPTAGGIVLSLERMNRIIEIDTANRLAIVEPGVTNGALQTAAGEHGFFWPPDPTSSAYCTIGGNLAHNSAGPRAVKYGTPRDNTLGLRIVTGAGQSMRTGTYTTKGVVGYDLTRLVIGSEGTLAIITQAILKLTPKPQTVRVMQAIYRDIHSAAQAVSSIMAQPATPCALEFIDGAAINMIRHYSKASLPENAGAMLMIEADGPHAAIDEIANQIRQAASNHGLLSFTYATTPQEIQALWNTRKALSPALRNVAPKKINEDVVVPVAQIPALIAYLEELSRRYNITIVNFGHAGNGNIHVNLLIDPDDPVQARNAHQCLDEVFAKVLELNGTISGEHGVGLEKRDFVARELAAENLTLMRDIKRLFDPNNILNPGKMLPPL